MTAAGAPDFAAMERTIWHSGDRRSSNMDPDFAPKPPEIHYLAYTHLIPLDRQLGLRGHFSGNTESVVTNQPLFQLSYAGSSLHTIDSPWLARPPDCGR